MQDKTEKIFQNIKLKSVCVVGGGGGGGVKYMRGKKNLATENWPRKLPYEKISKSDKS